jgi:hypothetical protein
VVDHPTEAGIEPYLRRLVLRQDAERLHEAEAGLGQLAVRAARLAFDEARSHGKHVRQAPDDDRRVDDARRTAHPRLRTLARCNVNEKMDEALPVHPIVDELATNATHPYRHLLPEQVVEHLRGVVAFTLDMHPIAIGCVARLSPALSVEVDMPEDAYSRGFQGYMTPHVQRALMKKVREIAERDGRAEFIVPDLSMAAVCAYVSYMSHNDRVWREPEPAVREVAQLFAGGIMAALFVGLVQELERKPSVTQKWGESGRAVADAVPRARATLSRAVRNVPPWVSGFLQAYQGCGWDPDRVAKRLHLRARKVNERCDEAMTRLGEALRAELTADTTMPT